MTHEILKVLKPGSNVHYKPKMENGIVKRIEGDNAFVVYNCNEEWSDYKNYTAACTKLSDLEYGFVGEYKNPKSKYCDHHYTPTNAKWQSAGQVECQWCGDVID